MYCFNQLFVFYRPKLRSKVHKTQSVSIVEKLANAYENGDYINNYQ